MRAFLIVMLAWNFICVLGETENARKTKGGIHLAGVALHAGFAIWAALLLGM